MRTAKRGMPGKRQLRFRREDAQAVVAATLGRHHEGCLGEVGPGCDRGHCSIRQPLSIENYRNGVSQEWPRPEHVDLLEPSFHVPTVLFHEIVGRVTPLRRRYRCVQGHARMQMPQIVTSMPCAVASSEAFLRQAAAS